MSSSPFVEYKEEDYEEEEEEEYLDETQVYLRSKFYESWLWMDVNLPSQVDKDGWVSLVFTGEVIESCFLLKARIFPGETLWMLRYHHGYKLYKL